ncbi:amino acid adenylation domain-containing protein [Streptomyces anulatus]|uniref:amino acid adenylation domain-containing protein n=1 Tax=Streptomyces anulatus TaxID=1892 RepID=UPI0036A416BA
MPTDCIHIAFRERAREAPHRIALSTPDGPVSYGELDARSDRLAARLATRGVRPGVLVGLCTRRGTEAIVAMLGVLKAGGAYVPVDPGYPASRIAYLLDDSGVSLVVATRNTGPVLADSHLAVVWVDDDNDDDAAAPLPAHADGDDLAYVIYTSGSTGSPKGVAVPHRNVMRLFTGTQPWFRFDHSDTWSLFHSISFDFSVWEIWGALLHGGRLVLLPETVARSPERLVGLLRSEGVTVLNLTPSAFHQLISSPDAGRVPPDTAGLALRLIVFGGERLDPRLLAPWVRRHGDRVPELVNMYGITETTVHCTYRPITAADVTDGSGSSPIGVPLPDLRVHLLDEQGVPLPPGVPGEMYVAGAGLARGYVNRPRLTSERFVAAPAGVAEERLYRTGDRAVRRLDGELLYLGRTDDQVKIRGYRIEPGEIEECLGQLPGIARVVAAPRNIGDGEVSLVAYLLPVHRTEPGGPEAARLTAEAELHVRGSLPRHVRPSHYQVVSEFPMTHQGKVNRDALGK